MSEFEDEAALIVALRPVCGDGDLHALEGGERHAGVDGDGGVGGVVGGGLAPEVGLWGGCECEGC